VVLPEDGLQPRMRAFLAERGIQTSIHYPPIHHFSEYAPESRRSLPVTDRISRRIVTLPLYAHMGDEQVTLVIEGVLDCLESAAGGLAP
jgi:dTDP-4-amino-4,6-dideoxygalactose transaminase